MLSNPMISAPKTSDGLRPRKGVPEKKYAKLQQKRNRMYQLAIRSPEPDESKMAQCMLAQTEKRLDRMSREHVHPLQTDVLDMQEQVERLLCALQQAAYKRAQRIAALRQTAHYGGRDTIETDPQSEDLNRTTIGFLMHTEEEDDEYVPDPALEQSVELLLMRIGLRFRFTLRSPAENEYHIDCAEKLLEILEQTPTPAPSFSIEDCPVITH